MDSEGLMNRASSISSKPATATFPGTSTPYEKSLHRSEGHVVVGPNDGVEGNAPPLRKGRAPRRCPDAGLKSPCVTRAGIEIEPVARENLLVYAIASLGLLIAYRTANEGHPTLAVMVDEMLDELPHAVRIVDDNARTIGNRHGKIASWNGPKALAVSSERGDADFVSESVP